MPIMVKFGDVFRFNEQEFVFLAQTDGVTYAAKILNTADTSSVVGLLKKKEDVIREHTKSKLDNVLYSFVMLTTPEYKNRMAHFKQTDKDGLHESFEVIGSLNSEDQKKIKEEILANNSAVPMKLKELVKDIDIE